MRFGRGLAVGALFVCLLASAADAPEYRAIAQLRANGFKRCASTLNALTKDLYTSDTFTYRAFWSSTDADTSTAAILAAQRGSDFVSYSYIASTPAAGPHPACDQSFTQVFVIQQSCDSVGDSFKDWEFDSPLGPVVTYLHPRAPGLKAALIPTQSGCVLVKTGATYLFPSESVKK